MDMGIYMRDESSTTEDTKSAGPSGLRLRVGVFLILLWIVPFWALAPLIANSLSGLSNPPSVAAVTTAIVAVQTILGLIGSWVVGTEVKSIIKGSTKRQPAVPECRAAASLTVAAGAYVKSVQQLLGHASPR
jgi:hypothetical protein